MASEPPTRLDLSKLEAVAARLASELYGGRWIVKASTTEDAQDDQAEAA